MIIRQLLILLVVGIFFACSTEKDHLIKIETRYGDMYALLYDGTPAHKENFIRMAKEGRFDSTEFHRVIQDFMIQGGDVFSKEGIPPEEWPTLPAEIKGEFFHKKGSIAAARQGDGINPGKRSSGSQFYIVQGVVYDELQLTTDMTKLQKSFMQYLQLETNKSLQEQYTTLYEKEEFKALNDMMLSYKEEMESFFNTSVSKKTNPVRLKAYTTIGGTPHLDDEYTVFGEVIKGFDVIDQIASEETSSEDRPLEPVVIKVTVEKKFKTDITKNFGYIYPKENE